MKKSIVLIVFFLGLAFQSVAQVTDVKFHPEYKVNNKEDILFDTNIPIVTNTTINTIVSELCTNITSEIDVKICEGDIYDGYEESGTYIKFYPLPFDCDSTVIINLEVQGITYSAQDIAICEGDVFELNGQEYILFESQEINDTLFNAEGCISNIMIFDIQVNTVNTLEIDTIICEGQDFNGLTESGDYTVDSFDIHTGCDITTTIHLEVLPINDPACLVGIDEMHKNKVKLYPNPARNNFFIEAEFPIDHIDIFSMSFQKVKEIEFSRSKPSFELSTENLNPGIYILAIKSKSDLIYKKLILE